MTEPVLPLQEYPQRAPLKVIGRGAEMDAERMAAIILEHLGPQAEADRRPVTHAKGAYTCHTFWVVLPDAGAEAPLRAALHQLPGVIMQL